MSTVAGAARLFINGKFAAQRTTGVQRYAACLVQALDRLLARLPAPPRCELLLPPGAQPLRLRHIGVRELPAPRWAPARLRLHAWEQRSLPAAARTGLLLNLSGSAPWFAGAQLATLHDAALWDQPLAYTPIFRFWYRRLFGHLVRRPGPRLVPSVFSQQRLAAALGVPAGRFQVVPGGGDALQTVSADPQALARQGLQPQGYVLAVASANPTKNLAALQRSWAALTAAQRGPCVLVLVGGAAPAVFSASRGAVPPSAQAGHPGPVRPLGPVDDAELKALMSQALGLVCPSVYEGFGLPPLEAMACGCPVAAARAAALPEVLGEAPLYFDPHDEADITRALAQLIGDADLRTRLGARGLAQAAAHTWDRAAAQLWPLLQAELSGGTGGSA